MLTNWNENVIVLIEQYISKKPHLGTAKKNEFFLCLVVLNILRLFR